MTIQNFEEILKIHNGRKNQSPNKEEFMSEGQIMELICFYLLGKKDFEE